MTMKPLTQIGLLTLLALTGCNGPSTVPTHPELDSEERPRSFGFMATLHKVSESSWQIVVHIPDEPSFALVQGRWTAALVGETLQTTISKGERNSSLGGEMGSLIVSWTFDRARWMENRPFQLRLSRGMESKLAQVTLGPKPGKAEGLELLVTEGS